MCTITPGTVVTFGRYIQYDNTYAATPIEWIVLDTDGHTAKLISRYGLEIMTYHDEQSEVSWENCALRTWLNTTFLNEAFSAEEQKQLQDVPVMISIVPESDAGYGRDTREKVSLLTIDEAERYFASDEERKCFPTEKALTYNMWYWNQYDGRGNECPWWLQSSGGSQNCAPVVIENGDILYEGWSVGSKYLEVAVRPVIALRVP